LSDSRNYKLLSFGEEAEGDEEEDTEIVKAFGKGKSSHDLANDPKLSSEALDIGSNMRQGDSDSEGHSDKGKEEET